MTTVKREFFSTATRGRWAAKWLGGGVERPRDRETPLLSAVTFSSLAGADAPDPLWPVGHLPRDAVEKMQTRVGS